MKTLPAPLLIVTDRHQAHLPLEEIVAPALDAGARWFWLRDRDLPADERLALARRLAGRVHAAGGTLSIGGDPALAQTLRTGAAHMQDIAGVTDGRRILGPDALIGMSAHTLSDITAARAAGADYVTLSPIFPTASKPGYGPALGLEAVRHAADLGMPVVALGGVSADTVESIMQAGAAGVAVMGEIMRAEKPTAPVRALLGQLSRTASP